MRWIAFLLALPLLAGNVKSQAYKCGHAERQQALWDANPELYQEYLKEDARLRKRSKEILKAWQTGEKKAVKYTIPVVFHIIHDNGPENVSNQAVYNVIEAINIDYSKNNPFNAQIASAFKGIEADCEINFKLATLDPAGGCTNGIIRYVDPRTVNGGEQVKENRQWDRTRYLNIWVVRNVDGAAAYSFYPGNSITGDGVIIGYRYLGLHNQLGTGASVLAHEVGHYLNLPHCWGNSNDPGMPNNCGGDDGVEDTPNTLGNVQCNLSAQSCGSLDNVQNFMEYAGCSMMFTEGQKARMHAALESTVGSRNKLHTAANLASVGADYETDPTNLCFADFQANIFETCAGNTVQFTDLSFHNPTAWKWEFVGGVPATSTEQNPTVVFNEAGVYEVKLSVSNAESSEISATKTNYITIKSSDFLSMPYQQDFSALQLMNTQDFRVIDQEEDGKTWQDFTGAGKGDDKCVYLQNRFNVIENIDAIESNTFSLEDMVSAELTFDYSMASRFPSNEDEISVYISTDCGVTYTRRRTIKASTLYTGGQTTGNFKPESEEDWGSTSVNLGPFIGRSALRFKIEFIAGGGNNVYIDNINISGVSSVSSLNYSKLEAYPNPASDSFVVLGLQGLFDVKIISTSGAVAQRFDGLDFQSEGKTIDVKELANGIYSMVVKGDNQVYVTKLVVQK